MDIYKEVCRVSQDIGEKNDCTVKSVAIATGTDYLKVREVMASLGRRTGKGVVFYPMINPALNALGFKAEELPTPRQPNGCRYSVMSIGKLYTEGCYIVLVKGHVFPLVNGNVYDWTAGRRHRVLIVWKITKLEE